MKGEDDMVGVGMELSRRLADMPEAEQRGQRVGRDLEGLADLLAGVAIEAEMGPEEVAIGPQPGDPLAILGTEPLDDLAHRNRG